MTGVIPDFSRETSSPSETGTDQPLTFQATAEMKVWRYGFIPVYWSRIGDLTNYHLAYFVISTITLCFNIGISYLKRGHRTIELIFEKPKSKVNNVRRESMTDTNRKGWRILTMIWAFIGVLWFILYQILAAIPYEISYLLVEVLNYFMWIMVVASVGWAIYPPIKAWIQREG